MNNKNTITINIFWKFAERAFAQIISFVVSIVLARMLLPTEFGTVAMVLVFINIANACVSSGISASLIQAKVAGIKEFSSVFFFNLFFSLFIYILLFLIAPIVGKFYNDLTLVPIVRVMSFGIIISAINSVQQSYVSRHMMFRKYFWSTLCGTLLSGVTGIVLAYLGFGVWALVLQYLTSIAVNTSVLFMTVGWRPIMYFSLHKVIKLLKFGWKVIFEGVCAICYHQLSYLIIGKIYTSNDLAYFNRGEQLSSILVNNIGVSVSSVLFPAMSSIQDDSSRVKLLLRKSVRLTSYVIFPLLLCLAMLSEPIIHILLTDKWNGTIPYLQLFCLIYAIQVGMYPRHQALLGIGRSDVFMNEHIIGRILGILFLFLFYKHGVFAVAVSVLFNTIIQMIIIMYTSKQYSNYLYREQIKDIIPSLVGCVIIAPFIVYIRQIVNEDWLQLMMSFSLGLVVYCVYSYFIKLDEFAFFYELVIKQIKRDKNVQK